MQHSLILFRGPPMKRCPICQTPYPDDANFCPMDAGKLVMAEPIAPAPVQAAPAADPATIGGRFQLGARLGGGHTGDVYHATDSTSGQTCAVKIVAPTVFPTPLVAQRTERELKQLGKVLSDRVCRLFDFGHHGGSLWIAMELCPGISLAQVVATSGPLQEPR